MKYHLKAVTIMNNINLRNMKIKELNTYMNIL